MATVLLSFVIPHKGREVMLQRTLQSIVEQQYDLSLLEVIVVTQNAGLYDSTYPDDERLKITTLIRPEDETISRLRNVGAKEAAGEYIAFLDADIELSEHWVTVMMDELRAVSDRVLVSSVQRCDVDAPPLEKIRTVLSNAATDCNVRFLPGRNLLLRRKTFDSVGGFPEHLLTCEDYYFTDKVSQTGLLYYSSAANYLHLGEDKQYREMFKKEIWRGQSNLQSIKGRRIPLSEWPSFLVPIWILLFFIFTVLALIVGAQGVGLLGFLLLLVPIVLYSIRLKRLAQSEVALRHIVQFYLMYFPARIIGTYYGLFAAIRV